MAGILVATLVPGCRSMGVANGIANAADGSSDAQASLASPDASTPSDEAIPQGPDEELTGRGKHLLEAISRNDAQLATDVLFPRDGWVATREGSDPGKEWEKRVASPFRRAIRVLSRRYPDFDRAKFVSFEMGRAMVQETPKRHGWRKPLWTIRESRLTFVVDGRTRMLPIREMTAWRGAWYVTKLR
ncbi:MAG: hypothetical protein ABSC94_07470 [Polyangiaceae bacterium]|jgi:hypothetical protein